MPVDTRGLRQEHVGKRIRIELAGGEIDEINLLELTICEKPEPCCGITYRLLSAPTGSSAKQQGEIYWTGFNEVENFQILGDALA